MPTIKEKEAPFASRICVKCGKPRPASFFIESNSWFADQGYSSVCNNCIKDFLVRNDFEWNAADKICQYFNIPFIPNEFERIHRDNGDDMFPIYARVFLGDEFEGLDWSIYNDEFIRLRDAGAIENEIPLVSNERQQQLQEKWGGNYDDEALAYLEDLYNGLLMTQNINGVLQGDQAKKICKLSYEIDCRIREGTDFDKVLKAYDTLVKTAEFTPKNVKNANDFDSVGELIKWLEKKGWQNKFYDGVTRDVVDETIKNIQSYNQRLYTNESGIGDEITQRIEGIRSINDTESYYDLKQTYDLDEFDNTGYEELMKEDFNAEV